MAQDLLIKMGQVNGDETEQLARFFEFATGITVNLKEEDNGQQYLTFSAMNMDSFAMLVYMHDPDPSGA